MRTFLILIAISTCVLGQIIDDTEFTSLDDVTEFTIKQDELKKFKVSPTVNRFRIVGTDYGYCGATPDYTFASLSPNLYLNFYCSDFAEIGTSHTLYLYRLPTARFVPPTFKNVTFTIE